MSTVSGGPGGAELQGYLSEESVSVFASVSLSVHVTVSNPRNRNQHVFVSMLVRVVKGNSGLERGQGRLFRSGQGRGGYTAI